ncbi:SET domain-containing protein [Dothidotthia symphoricarpi CBS 119687]|uniref:SET domain-containing protein n=1 Tax=Dothidotthia symphoricarpi CBS 119687 TaxID=1392245 RepID=A0A6A6A9H3_9PLEO|nr:SET domain-containing protein [Dothidotthia symphoricarpi CBS 119687]KAF2127754.1 SET domain-containing protein [Dothidotthia symphoricarpi CBS 119687]
MISILSLCISLGSLSLVLAGPTTCKLPSPSIFNTSDIPLWQVGKDICQGPPDVYFIKHSKGKGLGLFAAHDLEVGDAVMREPPILKIRPPESIKGAGYPMAAITKLVRTEFNNLSSDAQAAIMGLTYHATPTEKENFDKLGIIFRTNAYNTGNEIGLFPKIARINHSCRPNTSYYWSEKLNKRIVYATRPIKAGEEFSVSYIPLLLTWEERQKRLNRYGFTCTCEACAQEQVAMQASDTRRLTINKAFVTFEHQLHLTPPKSRTEKEQAVKNAKASIQLAELVQQEGLADYYAKAYRIVAISHARVEDWEPAAVWANRGYELKFMEDPESVHTAEMHHLTSNFIASWESELNRTHRHHHR